MDNINAEIIHRAPARAENGPPFVEPALVEAADERLNEADRVGAAG